MSGLVIVSNRVASPTAEAAAGGLAVGLKAALEEAGGLWFGWSGSVSPNGAAIPEHEEEGAYAALTTDLNERQFHGFYEDFANRTLWPVLHGRLDLAAFEAEAYAIYKEVNALFAERLRPHLEQARLIWVHDYHLLLLARDLRQAGVEAPLGFFLHTPCPHPDVLSALPWAGELADALLAFDLLGFQTRGDQRNFTDFVERELGETVTSDGTVERGGHRTRTGAFPIGINADYFSEIARSQSEREWVAEFTGRFGDRRLLIGVDRLDYTKGLDHRFRAFEIFLDRSPEHRGHVNLLQIAAPSREDVPEYVEMREDLETLSGHINGRFAELDWLPIRYINRSFGQAQLAALYRMSHVGLVTPLRDGMNIVAKEYVAAQDPGDPGVLLLSRFSGVAEELVDALLVNPYDIEGVARAIGTALAMPLDERRDRYARLQATVSTYTVHHWWRTFLQALKET